MKRTEQALQIACVEFARRAIPSIVIFHVPNGGYRSPAEGHIFKRMGVLKGVADLTILLPQGGVGFCEIKSPKGKLTPEQLAFQGAATGWGAEWNAIWSLEDFERTLRAWFPREPFRATVLGPSHVSPPIVAGKPR